MSWAGVILALTVPWLTGAIWLRRVWREDLPGARALAIGYGYLLGLFAAVTLLYLLSPMGLSVAYWIAWLLLALTAWLGGRRRRQPNASESDAGSKRCEQTALWEQGLTWLVLVWLGLRLASLAAELWWQPLFPWDAWTTWAARARVWAETGHLVSFVGPADWLSYPSGERYTIGAWAYPKVVSLLTLWPTLAYGEWNETAAKLPWLGCLLALGLGFYGQARQWGATRLEATLGVWLLVSLPLLSTHVALAGYADLWMAASLGLGAIALVQWSRNADPRQGFLALLLALSCPFIKSEGTVWLGLFLPAALAARLSGRWLLALLASGAGLGLVVLIAGGVTLTIPRLGVLELSPSVIEAPLIGRFELSYHDSWMQLVKNLFIFDNWHLLAYVMAPAILLGLARAYRDMDLRWLRVELALVLGSLLALFVLFFFTDAYRWAEQSTSLARLLLHFTPIYVFYLLTLWIALARPPAPALSKSM